MILCTRQAACVVHIIDELHLLALPHKQLSDGLEERANKISIKNGQMICINMLSRTAFLNYLISNKLISSQFRLH